MNQITKCVLFFIAGALFSFFLFRSPVPIRSSDAREKEIVRQEVPTRPAAIPTPASSKPMPILGQRQLANIPPEARAKQAEPTEEPKPQNVEIVFSDELVSQMEKDWSDLRSQVQLARESRGWRVLSVRQDSLFAQAGFLDGDLISDDAIRNLGKGSLVENDRLINRVTAILHQVTR